MRYLLAGLLPLLTVTAIAAEETAPQAVMFQVCVVEVDPAQLGKSALELVAPDAKEPRDDAAKETLRLKLLGDADHWRAMIERLRAAEGVKFLANPTLVTRGGQAASFISGGKTPVAALDEQGRLSEQLRFVGTQVELTPRSVEDEKVRFDIQLGVSKLSASQRAKINGKSLPFLQLSNARTGFEMRSGQACVMGGLAQRREEGGRVQELELLVLIRAEIIGQCAQ